MPEVAMPTMEAPAPVAAPIENLDLGNAAVNTPEVDVATNLESVVPEAAIHDLAGIEVPNVNTLKAVENAPDLVAGGNQTPSVEVTPTAPAEGATPPPVENTEPTPTEQAAPENSQPAPQPETGQPASAEATVNAEAVIDAGGDGTPPQASPEVQNQPENPPAEAEGKSEDEKAARQKELQDKANELTPDERKELNELNKETAANNRRQELIDKQAKGEVLNDDELAELDNAEAESEGGLTQEQLKEQLAQEVEDTGTELMQRLMNGEDVKPEELTKFQELAGKQALMENGFTAEQARRAVQEGLRNAVGNSERGSRRTREAQERVQELMSLEVQLIASRNAAQQLKEGRAKAIDVAKARYDEAQNAKPEERAKKNAAKNQAYMTVANFTARIEGTRYMAQRVNARRQDLEQEVRRKLGITGGLEAVTEWAGAKVNNAMTEIAIIAEEEVPLGQGAFLGEFQRGRLASSGRM